MLLNHLFGAVRTTGIYGFRPARVEKADYVKNGWEMYHKGTLTEHDGGSQPHYQANMHAMLILGGRITQKESLFVDRVQEAMRRMMALPTTEWRWTEYLSEELAHLLLPLSWLYRLRPTPEVKGWLDVIASSLLARQRPCGAITEFLGTQGLGDTPPPSDNAAFGLGEGSLIQEDADPAADLLYTQNFALVAFTEAFAATGDAAMKAARDKLIDFFLRAQARAPATGPASRLEGTWFRAFDVEKWEYWASTTDWAYGPWETENGWTVGWVSAAVSLAAKQSSFWDAMEPFVQRVRADPSVVQAMCLSYLTPAFCV